MIGLLIFIIWLVLTTVVICFFMAVGKNNDRYDNYDDSKNAMYHESE